MQKTIELLFLIVFILALFIGCNSDGSQIHTDLGSEAFTDKPTETQTEATIEKPATPEEENHITYFREDNHAFGDFIPSEYTYRYTYGERHKEVTVLEWGETFLFPINACIFDLATFGDEGFLVTVGDETQNEDVKRSDKLKALFFKRGNDEYVQMEIDLGEPITVHHLFCGMIDEKNYYVFMSADTMVCLIRSFDGGENWEITIDYDTAPDGGLHNRLFQADFLTEDVGFIVFDNWYKGGYIDNLIYLTSDGGKTWRGDFLTEYPYDPREGGRKTAYVLGMRAADEGYIIDVSVGDRSMIHYVSKDLTEWTLIDPRPAKTLEIYQRIMDASFEFDNSQREYLNFGFVYRGYVGKYDIPAFYREYKDKTGEIHGQYYDIDHGRWIEELHEESDKYPYTRESFDETVTKEFLTPERFYDVIK